MVTKAVTFLYIALPVMTARIPQSLSSDSDVTPVANPD